MVTNVGQIHQFLDFNNEKKNESLSMEIFDKACRKQEPNGTPQSNNMYYYRN
jgi:hypothetical protein